MVVDSLSYWAFLAGNLVFATLRAHGEVTGNHISPRAERPIAAPSSRFFVWMALCMLGLNLVGFAPSYFLGNWFESHELPLRTHIHGVIFTGWFVLLLAQVSLVAGGSIRRHRQIGVVATILIVLMVISALVLLYHRALLFHTGDRDLEGTVFVVWGNLSLLVAFATFAVLGFLLRKRPSFHKRLMMLASVAMMPQALGRFGYFPQLQLLDGMANNALCGYGGILLLLIAIAVHDRMTEGRLHPATSWGAPTLILMLVVGTVLVPQTSLGSGLILALQ